ncbi:MAG: nucleotide exchange factor GrpE [Nitrospiraceae bacterium]|nr:nucleotide exchange factor GrpE [Nitrospiraceae bacterium]
MAEENIFEKREGRTKEEGLIEERPPEETIAALEKEVEEEKEKYLRLYAEFENYRKMAAREREDASKRAVEDLISALLPTLDNLETALKHAPHTKSGLAQGVEMTLRELKRVLEKAGLKAIDALGRPFDPAFHHAISQVERDDTPDKTVVEELRTGYVHNGKVLRASLVAVSRKKED